MDVAERYRFAHKRRGKMIDLSIVIVSYNTLRLTRECIESTLRGLGKLSAEVIVVDNHSTDGSVEMILGEFPSVRLIENATNAGFAAANNQALRVAVGRHLLLLNSDTVVLGDVLDKSVEYMDGNPGVAVMGCRVLNGDGSLQHTCSMFPSPLNLGLMTLGVDRLGWPAWLNRYRMTHWDRREEREVEVVTGCYMLIRREALEEVGGLDEGFFFYGEETDWCRRCGDAGWGVRFAPVGEIVHYGSGSCRSLNYRRDLLLSRGLVGVNRKHGGVVAGAATWVVLLVFNVSRCVGYAARCAVRGGWAGSGGGRVSHFARVSMSFHTVWGRGTAGGL